MSDIFLSYASEDRERVRPLAEALAAEGWAVFWDRIIPVGKTWDEVLEEELKAARCLLVVWSKHSIKSEWVKEEANEARRLQLPLLPILLDDVTPPLGFRGIQAADFSTWDGSRTSPAFQTLARDIKRTLGPAPEPIKPVAPELEPPQPETPKPEPAEPRTPKILEIMKRNRGRLIGVSAGLALILLMVGFWWFFLNIPANRPPQPDPPPLPNALSRITNRLGMQFVLIPGGTFNMGSPAGESGRDADERQHQVTLSRPFYLQTTEVTQGQWQKVMGNSPSYFKECGENCPVENVSWNEAQEFIAKLNQMEKTDKYRLPTEAEWEYACRAGSTNKWSFFGEDEAKLGDYAF